MSLCTCRGAGDDVEVFKCNLQELPFGAFILADKRDQGIIIFIQIASCRSKLRDVVNWILH